MATMMTCDLGHNDAMRAAVTMRTMSNIVIESTLRDRLDSLVSRRRDAWLVALGVGVVVLIALVLWGRGATARIAPPASASSPGAVAVLPAPSPSAVVYVDVGGAVPTPGLYSLAAGSRIADALAAAGGALPRADVSALNLAEVVVDGSKVMVPVRGASRDDAAAVAPATAGSPATGALVPLNTADQAALETVPGIGPVTALAILSFRAEIGAFQSIDQLLEVDGIGPATLEEIRAYLTV
jgi:competence protein ComEA